MKDETKMKMKKMERADGINPAMIKATASKMLSQLSDINVDDVSCITIAIHMKSADVEDADEADEDDEVDETDADEADEDVKPAKSAKK